jgi:hypothetical protein
MLRRWGSLFIKGIGSGFSKGEAVLEGPNGLTFSTHDRLGQRALNSLAY